MEWERTVRHSDLSLLGARTNNGHNRGSFPPMTFFHTPNEMLQIHCRAREVPRIVEHTKSIKLSGRCQP